MCLTQFQKSSMITIVNAATSEVKNYSFNPWGMPRDATNWTQSFSGELFADRGYTGHEHLTEFNLINMNGRVYDPILGRFLSPDPFVQAPGYPNNYNRYSYALNNPLRFTDPSGYYNKPSPLERERAKEDRSYYNPYFNIANPQLAGNYHTSYTPGSGFGGTIEDGTYFDWKTGRDRPVYMEVLFGKRYYKQQTGSYVIDDGTYFWVSPGWGPNVYLDENGNWQIEALNDGDPIPYNQNITSAANTAVFAAGVVQSVAESTVLQLGKGAKGLSVVSKIGRGGGTFGAVISVTNAGYEYKTGQANTHTKLILVLQV